MVLVRAVAAALLLALLALCAWHHHKQVGLNEQARVAAAEYAEWESHVVGWWHFDDEKKQYYFVGTP